MLRLGQPVFYHDHAETRFFYCTDEPESLDNFFASGRRDCMPWGKPIKTEPK